VNVPTVTVLERSPMSKPDTTPVSEQNDSKPDWYDVEWRCRRIQEEGQGALASAFSGPKWTTIEQLRGLEGDLDTLKLRVIALRTKLERWGSDAQPYYYPPSL